MQTRLSRALRVLAIALAAIFTLFITFQILKLFTSTNDNVITTLPLEVVTSLADIATTAETVHSIQAIQPKDKVSIMAAFLSVVGYVAGEQEDALSQCLNQTLSVATNSAAELIPVVSMIYTVDRLNEQAGQLSQTLVDVFLHKTVPVDVFDAQNQAYNAQVERVSLFLLGPNGDGEAGLLSRWLACSKLDQVG